MNRGVWAGCLLLSLAVHGADVVAQEASWRPAPAAGDAPRPATQGAYVELGRPYAELGRPIAAPARDSAARAGVLPVAYPPPTPLATAGRNSALPPPEDDREPGDFAVDRPPPIPPPPATSPEVAPAALTADAGPGPSAASMLPPTLPPPVAPDGGAPANPFFPPAGFLPPPPGGHGFPGEPARPRLYLQGEYLLWAVKSDHVPALLTTGPVSAGALAGAIGQPTTQVLFGDRGLDGGFRSGFRGKIGYWFDDTDLCQGVEFGGFVLGSRSTHFSTSSAANGGVLARPFFNLNTGAEDVQVVGFPGLATGTATVSASSRLGGLEVNYRAAVCCSDCARIDVFGGFRYLDLKDNLAITEDIIGDPNAPGASFRNKNILVLDQFSTHDQFYGGQLGVSYDRTLSGPWVLNVTGKLGLGDTHETVNIAGSQTVIDRTTGAVQHFVGGLYTAPTNIGHFTRDRFSVVPELGLTLGYQINDHWRVFGGYNFLYWSNVVRPGGQLDRVIDTTNVPNLAAPGTVPTGTNHPAVLFKETDLWVQGLNVGVEFKF